MAEIRRCMVPVTYGALARILQLPEGAEIEVVYRHPGRRKLELNIRGYGYIVAEGCLIPQISPTVEEIDTEELGQVICVTWPEVPETE